MPLQLGPVPDFRVKIPDMTQAAMQAATLSQMLNENKLRQSLAPLQVQEQQQRVQAQEIENQMKTMQLQGQRALADWLQNGDANAEVPPEKFSSNDKIATYVGVTPNDPIMSVVRSMAQHHVPAPMLMTEAQGMLQRRNEYYKGTKEEQDAQKNERMVWQQALAELHELDPQQRSVALAAKLPLLQENSKTDPLLGQYAAALNGHPELIDRAYNTLSAENAALGLREARAKAKTEEQKAMEFAAKTDPNSPFYDPSAAYLAKKAAAGDPEAKSILAQQAKQAGAKAGAEEAAKYPYELKLKQEEQAPTPAFAFNPQTGQRELTTIGEARAKGLQYAKVGEPDIEKETQLNSQMNDMQLNTSRYRAALNTMGPLSQKDRDAMTRILSDKSIGGYLTNELTLGALMDQISQGEKGKAWNDLSADKQTALIGYLRMKNTGLLAQKVLTGLGRASKEALDIELSNMPSPIDGATVGNKKLDAWQDNLDQINSRSVKLPWMETPKEVRTRVEGQATQQYNQAQAGKQQGQYRAPSGATPKVGQNIQLPHVPGLSIVKKVYSDGSFDADQRGFRGFGQ